MRKRKLTFITALASGLLCALAVASFMLSVQGEASAARAEALARYGGEQLEVCVATRTIEAGEAISATNTTTRLWLVDLLPQGAVESLSAVAGKTVTSPVVAGEVITSRRFEGAQSVVPIPQGLAAVSIDLGAAPAVADLLEPGAFVDVYAVGSSACELLMSRALVSAVEAGSGNGKRVTLAVLPERVQELVSATQKESIYLSMPAPAASGEPVAPDEADGPAVPEEYGEPAAPDGNGEPAAPDEYGEASESQE